MPAVNYQAVLFDLDGTLLDTAPDFAIALNQLLARKERPPLTEAAIRAIVSNGSAGLIAHAFNCTEEDAEFEAIRSEFLEVYLDNLCQQTRPFPGIETLLKQLGAQGTPWGIVTNKPSLYTQVILDELKLQPAPGSVVCPDHVEHAKPHPEPVLLGCKQLGSEPQHTIYVGDHRRDIESGRDAGTITIAAAYGYIDDDHPQTWGARHLVNHVDELTALLF
ncbi:MAG: phosphoglycolate phosphatase [Gammaproteobacteria bacterium]|nr:MAG: phosphoglycolate phosphatase [Gammaproteobacteria bacterium]RLA44247.1 MAG: phosphoglycolate phosphatase [Gammaproteobacteria bacterium]